MSELYNYIVMLHKGPSASVLPCNQSGILATRNGAIRSQPPTKSAFMYNKTDESVTFLILGTKPLQGVCANESRFFWALNS